VRQRKRKSDSRSVAGENEDKHLFFLFSTHLRAHGWDWVVRGFEPTNLNGYVERGVEANRGGRVAGHTRRCVTKRGRWRAVQRRYLREPGGARDAGRGAGQKITA
jgi:hypothetical protein